MCHCGRKLGHCDNSCESNKPIRKEVIFYKTSFVKSQIILEESAFIHPVVPKQVRGGWPDIVKTTRVLAVFPSGIFETEDAIYKPEEMQ